MDKAGVLAIYEAQKARYSGRDLIQATRTEVHAAMQLETPAPARLDGEDPDDHHMRQKAYGKALWKETDRLIAEAGVTP